MAICTTLSKLLADQGYTTSYSLSGNAGIQAAKEEKYDIVLLDLQLPDINGLEILRRIKAINPNIVAIIITAHPSPETIKEALKNGAHDYIVKPFNLEQLIFAIEKASSFCNLLISNKKLKDELDKKHKTTT